MQPRPHMFLKQESTGLQQQAYLASGVQTYALVVREIQSPRQSQKIMDRVGMENCYCL
ncbi:hypothetical protein BDZ91DRAFT_712450 [Kalaharituber pfeilii]|nr:hypothetical protein BDZ91DRAFT_717460 [Kalaharituber pfeilii]KAF8475113.1 hypothetical protein BDZ91DRAFT_712450 [Kalaharituber pfeilii]